MTSFQAFDVIGGGPAASLTSFFLLKKGYDVNIFWNGRFKTVCSGIVSERVYKELAAITGREIFMRHFKEVIFHFGDRSILFRPKSESAVLIHRPLLDRLLLKRAEDEGARLKREWRPSQRPTVIADGAFSQARAAFGLRRPRFQKAVLLRGRLPGQEQMEVFIDEHFSWIIPRPDGVEIGSFGPHPFRRAISLAHNLSFEEQERRAWVIPLGPVYAKPPLYIIGDAAGITKPITGGGIGLILPLAKAIPEQYTTVFNKLHWFMRLQTISKPFLPYLFSWPFLPFLEAFGKMEFLP